VTRYAIILGALLTLVTNVSARGQGPSVDRVRFMPAAGREQALVGGKFTGSNISARDGYEVFAEIKDVPKAGTWTEFSVPNAKTYRWVRYEAPPGSRGGVAEVEFHAGSKKLNGIGFGSLGEVAGRNWRRALDGDPKTWFESDAPNGNIVGYDLGEQATARRPAITPKPGDYSPPQVVQLRSQTKGAVIRYTLDGTQPGVNSGSIYKDPISVDRTTTFVAVAIKEGAAPSPAASGTFLVGSSLRPGLHTFHLGNSLTATTHLFAPFARTAGYPHVYQMFGMGGATTQKLWEVGLIEKKADWEKALAALPTIDHLTVQPRDFDIDREADYDVRFFDKIRAKSPDVQPWLYTEWVEKQRQRPTDKGQVASSQIKKPTPALTWEESMGAMLLYVEELQRRIDARYKGPKRPRVLPSSLAMGWIMNMIDRGEVPGMPPGSFYPLLFNDGVHPNEEGGYLVDLTWFAAFYGESPEGKVLPVGTNLTADQAKLMQRLAWDIVKNYPDCGLYEIGTTPAEPPGFSPAASAIGETTRVTLSSNTPGAWFRYTLDGTTPTRTTGYVYCGVISVRPGMTLKAVAYKSGMADSTVAEATFPSR
jgi:hypothetical protein